jgi:hypothetical protein
MPATDDVMHTPTPADHLSDIYDCAISWRAHDNDRDEEPPSNWAQTIATAIRAVNSHDELVDVLRHALRVLHPWATALPEERLVIHRIEAALARADKE